MSKDRGYECPFTWNFDKYITDIESPAYFQNRTFDDENNLYLVKLSIPILVIYINAIKAKEATMQEYLEILEVLRNDLPKEDLDKNGISTRVIYHIIQSTFYYALEIMRKTKEAQELQGSLKKLVLTNGVEKATLNGFKSLMWKYFESLLTAEMGKKYAQMAIHENSKCAFWHYIYAVHERRIRQLHGYIKPTFLERKNFYEAYRKEKNPFFGIRLALCYKENCDAEKALELYHELERLNICNFSLNLRLALGFIYYTDLPSAKKCFDKVEIKLYDYEKSPMYLHYKGLYFKKLGNYEEAVKCLRKSGKMNNFKADINLVECLYAIDRNTDLIQFFKELSTRYEDEYSQINIHLHLGMVYFKEKTDLSNSLIHFEKAIKINPKSGIFENYFYPIQKGSKINIFNFLETRIFPCVKKMHNLDTNGLKAYNNLKVMYNH